MPISVDRFIKVMSSGLDISPALVASRSGKVDAALAGVAAIRQADPEVFSKLLTDMPEDRLAVAVQSITARKAAALALPDDQARYAALEQVKSDAKSLEKAAKRKVKRLTDYFRNAYDRMSDPDSDAGKLEAILAGEGKTFLALTREVLKRADYAGVSMAKLKPEEAVAVIHYTYTYKDLNAYLNKVLVPDSQELVDQFELRKKVTVAALAKLPPSPGASTRGDDAWNGSDTFYANGNDATVTAFYSSGRNYAFTRDLRITIAGKSGREIAGYSSLPYENEVLFLPGTRFHVMAYDGSDPAAIAIVLREI